MGEKYGAVADIHFSIIPREDRSKNVLIMFEPRSVDRRDGKRPKQKVRK
jgi:hypothetical protein